MKLVIVESPTKCKTIGKYLGSDYEVLASLGHIRDLAISGAGGLGVDVEDGFTPKYVISDDKKKVVAELKKKAKLADEVILATDPDREGEAIAWHLAQVLKLDVSTTKRLEFHEITSPAILKAVANPRTIDMNLVASQETRRIIDRIMGFKLSSLLQRKIRSRSAGRVQSVTLKLIVEKEKEINAFIPEEYWSIAGEFGGDKKNIANAEQIKASLEEYLGKAIRIKNEEEANAILKALPEEFVISSIKSNERKRESRLPFTTSTMQQDSFNQFHYSTKKTSMLAQKLYEGIDIGGVPQGLITYMRTDSTRLSPEFVAEANSYIVNNFGKQYLGFVKKGKEKANVQDAHEAIRPTNILFTPSSIRSSLSKDEYNLYSLIYARALASLMSARIEDVTVITMTGNDYGFKVEGTILKFDGYAKIYNEFESKAADRQFPRFTEGQLIASSNITSEQHFTKAPARYSEAKIVKTMEELGIGRPSTYSSTIETLQKRNYVVAEKGILSPTEQGMLTVDKLSDYFSEFMSSQYTSDMESSLDLVVDGNNSRNELLASFYDKIVVLVGYAEENMEKKPYEETGEVCPDCGKPLIVRTGKFGNFVGCSGFPDCKYIKKNKTDKEPAKENGMMCPQCGKPLVDRMGRNGKPFIACSGFPKCRYTLGVAVASEEEEKIEHAGDTCPKCNVGVLNIKSSRFGKFLACSNYPSCKYTEKIKKNDKTED